MSAQLASKESSFQAQPHSPAYILFLKASPKQWRA